MNYKLKRTKKSYIHNDVIEPLNRSTKLNDTVSVGGPVSPNVPAAILP